MKAPKTKKTVAKPTKDVPMKVKHFLFKKLIDEKFESVVFTFGNFHL